MNVIKYLKEHYRVTELEHAWRINGTLDLYKKLKTVHIIPEGIYYRSIENEEKLLDIVINHLGHYKEQWDDFKKLPSA